MSEGLLHHRNLDPEEKLLRITKLASELLLGSAKFNTEIAIMRLAVELQHEIVAAKAAGVLSTSKSSSAGSNVQPMQSPYQQAPTPTPPPAASVDEEVKVRLAKVLEDNQRLRDRDRRMEKVRREMQDLLVTRNREIAGMRTQLKNRDDQINKLTEALQRPAEDDRPMRELAQLMSAAPRVRG